MRKIIAVWLCALLMISSVFVVGTNVNKEIEGSDVGGVGPAYVPHAPIRIDSDAGFPGIATAGDGSSGDPWIIEGYDINGTGFGFCIYIGNTTDYFALRDCNLHNASGNSAYYYWDSGLVLHQVQNGIVDNNTISSNEKDGIYFGVGCRNNTITGNNITSNTDNGIFFAQSGFIIITDNNEDDWYPQINNAGEVVWYGHDGSNYEIYFWDGVTTTQITNNSLIDDHPQINDNGEVVWNTFDGIDLEIFFWDGVTTTQITNDPGLHDWYPQINNAGEVAWYGHDGNDHEIFFWDGVFTWQITNNGLSDEHLRINDNGELVWCGDWEIFFWDGTNTTQVTNNSFSDHYSQINDNGEVVWRGGPVSNDEIYFWDGTNTTQVTNNSFSDHYPQINDNGEVVWRGGPTSNYEIYFWDGTNTTQVTNNSFSDHYPQINDNGEVVWRGGPTSNYEIYFWDGTNTTQVTNNSFSDHYPQINDNGEVVWHGGSVSNYDIYFWDGTDTTQVTNNSYDDYAPQINNNGEVVWLGYDGNDNEIYFYYGPPTTHNTISNNNITSNTNSGIYLNRNSDDNTITNNTLFSNNYGISLNLSSGNMIYHNNIIGNTNQAWDNTGNNFWNNTYPIGGNYWGDYTGLDFNCMPTQDVPPPDGIGDTPYTNILGGAGAVDNYPLMKPSGDLDIYPPDHYNEFPAPGSTIDDLTPTISVIVVDTSGIDTNTIRFYVNSIPVFYSLDPFATGYNVSYWHSGGFIPGEVVTCRIVAEDIHGNELDFTWDFTVDVVEDDPPDHSNEYPPIDGNSQNITPVISVHVTDNSSVDSSTIRLYVQGFSVFYSLETITDGYNVSYYWDTDFSPGEVVTCRIVAEDIYGNILDFTWEFTVLYAFSKPLVSGWNFLSIPVIPYSGGAFDSIAGKWDYIQYYDASDDNDHWKTYSIYKPPSLNDLTVLSLHWGFWLHTTEACTWYLNGTLLGPTGIQLYAGWNMVGYPTFTEKSIADALAGTGYDRPVETYNATAPYHIGPLADTYMMQPGEGYWVHVPADTTWVVDW